MSHAAAAPSNLASGLVGEHQRVLARIFQHPLSHNLSWRETLALISHIGAVDHQHDGNMVLRLGEQHVTFKGGHDKDLDPQDIMMLRQFVARAGWAPDGAAEPVSGPVEQDLVIVIDHEGARVFALSLAAGHVAPHETHHLLHEVKRKQHDADREETYPADMRYFDQIATAVAGTGRIVVIGHGTGQSNEADHLMDYLLNHHDDVHARVARTIVADLPHMTQPQLLQLARHTLQPALISAIAAPH